jgi:hypothetical protein
MGQLLEDAKLLVKTDTRIWAAGGFIAVVLLVWALTDSWRPLPELQEERYVTLIEEPERNVGFLLQGLNEGLGAVSKQNEVLQNDLSRVSRNIESKQEEIDWQIDRLVTRLGSMTDTIDDITRKVGEKTIEETIREKKQENRAKRMRR